MGSVNNQKAKLRMGVKPVFSRFNICLNFVYNELFWLLCFR